MVSLENVQQAKATYEASPSQSNYAIYKQLVDKYNAALPQQQQQQQMGPVPIPPEIQQLSSSAQLQYRTVAQLYQSGRITEEQANKMLEPLYRRISQGIQKRFQSYDAYAKMGFFIKNPQYVESLPQEDKDRILAATAYGKDFISDLLKKEPGTQTETALGIFLAAGGGEYRVIQEYIAQYRKAEREGNTAKMAEYKEYMIARASKLKLEQQGLNLGTYILSQPMVQFAATYGLARGLMKLPKPIQYGIGGALITTQIPSAVEAVRKGQIGPYIQAMVPALAGGYMAGVAARSPAATQKLYKPPVVKPKSVTMRVAERFPGVAKKLSPYYQRAARFKPIKSYLRQRELIRLGGRPSRDIPISKRTVTKVGEKYTKWEIFKGRGKKGIITREELLSRKFKPGTKTDPTFKLTVKKTVTPTGKETMKITGLKMLEKTIVTKPKRFLGRYRIERGYAAIRKEATLRLSKDPLVKLIDKPTIRKPFKIGGIDTHKLDLTPKVKTKAQLDWAAYKKIAALPSLKKTRFGRIKEFIPTESQYQIRLRKITGIRAKPTKFKFRLPERRPFISDGAMQTLAPQLDITTRQTVDFAGRAARLRARTYTDVFKVPTIQTPYISTIGATALTQQQRQRQLRIPESIQTHQPIQLQIKTPAQLQLQVPLQAQLQVPILKQELKTAIKLKAPPITKTVTRTRFRPVPITIFPVFIPPTKEEEKKRLLKIKAAKKLKYREREFKIKPVKLFKPKKVKP